MAKDRDTRTDDDPVADRDEPEATDLPLHSIPSVPDDLLSDAEGESHAGGGSGVNQLLAAVAILILIVSAAVLGVRFVKLPRSAVQVPPTEERAIESALPRPDQPAAGEAAGLPAGANLPPLRPTLAAGAKEKSGNTSAASRTAAAVSPSLADDDAPTAVTSEPTTRETSVKAAKEDSAPEDIERLLAERTQALESARSALQKEREARRLAERKLAEAVKDAARTKSARGGNSTNPPSKTDKLDRKERARLKELETQLAATKRELETSQRQTAEAEARAKQAEGGASTVRSQVETADKRARTAEAEIAAERARHEQALKGESAAVRKLVADLAQAQKQAANEKAARLEAEQKLRSLEARGNTSTRASNPVTEDSSPSAQQSTGMAARTSAAGTTEPQRVRTPAPRYPEELRRSGIAGRVTLKLLIGETGSVEEARVESAPDRRLGQVAVDAARRWQYQPGRKDGVRTRMWITELVDFRR